jgi:asparagine synthase (glutamine-hydrolysing)
MCGLAGFLKAGALSPDDIHRDLVRMAATLAHRGPDDEGVWCDSQAGVALCHRRLSIIDLSPLGHQPMSSAGGRFTIVYNGELYNYRDLRTELIERGYSFRSGSDTEVLLAAVECWGVAAALERFAGMFAFALWDAHERLLHLARDRFGEKPLYVGVCGGVLLFGSELKALRQHPAWTGEIDRAALALMMERDFVPAPHSIFKNVRKVMPGRLLTVRRSSAGFSFEEHRYWRPELLFEEGAHETPALTASESVELVEASISRAVERQMVAADVPVGAFLSGGTDSSLIVAMMQKIAARPVQTFSIGFTETAFDESPYASAVAEHLGTNHTQYIVTARDCLDVIPQLPRIYDEPFADPSQVPTYLLCRLTRSAVTVALSGDGGDELFGGYDRYATVLSRWRAVRRLPTAVRAGGSALMERLPRSALEIVAKPAAMIWRRHGTSGLAERLHDRSPQLKAETLRAFYQAGQRRWPASSGLVLGVDVDATVTDDAARPKHADDLKQLMYTDTCQYLPDDILVKVDRAAMGVSLETRIPLLDVDVARTAWRIPSAVLRSDGRGKWVLRHLLRRHLPDVLVNRPKKGFGVPLSQWLRAELRPWASALLDPYRLRQDRYLDAASVQRRWRQHLSGQANWPQHLWNVLTFQAWLEDWRRAGAVPDLRARA